MKTQIIAVAVSMSIAGCMTTAPAITTPAGQPIKFSNPILDKTQRATAKYVLLEKNIADGRYVVVSMSATRQTISNARQERIAFSADLTAFAPDYDDTAFRTYIDNENYAEKTVITGCGAALPKTQHYSPCNSNFGELFVPTGVTKAYVAGRKSAEAMKEWNDPARNRMRYVESPKFALIEAGVFQRLSELANAQ